MQALLAPRTSTRRIARVYIFPWTKPAFALALAWFGWRYQIPIPVLSLFVFITFLISAIEDLTTAQSRIMRLTCLCQSVWGKLRRHPRQYQGSLNETRAFFTARPPLFFQIRHSLRWALALTALCVFWGFAWIQAALYSTPNDSAQLAFTLALFFTGLIPYSTFIISHHPEWLKPNDKRRLWYSVAILGPLLAFASLRSLAVEPPLIYFPIFLFICLYIVIFAIQRLWVGQKVLADVVQNIHLEFLNWSQASQKLLEVPQLIGSRLKIDRVFVLQPTPDEQYLRITAEHGDHPSIMGKEVPISQSVTGRAYLKKQPVIWNNVAACPYYHPTFTKDDTRAEMAIPILYHGTVYSILDVQSKVKGAYSPSDLAALETIGRVLGAAIAVDKRDQIFRSATQLWQHVMSAPNSFKTEQDVFDVFAQFARQHLDADLIIYLPLSLAGYPVKQPFSAGAFNRPELLHAPVDNEQSSLIQLVADWKPYFKSHVSAESIVAQFSNPGTPGFVEREGISSTCFLPVGVYQERLGALFLNYREPKLFDDSFQFTVLSLAQSLAQATAQVRYRDVVYKSFGRPEINVHSIIGRYGFKKGVMTHARGLHADGEEACCQEFIECQLSPIITEMDDFVTEMRLADSAQPPDFWEASLESQLTTFKSALPNREDGRRPRLKLDIDANIEQEYALVKLALYRVITEAISNAIFHGSAGRIQVCVYRNPITLEVEITNNGRPLPHNAENRKGLNGIYTLLQECQTKLGASARIANQPNDAGVIVSVTIPALPI